MKLISLIENTAGAGLPGEHGLSVWIELGGRGYLLDTGASDGYLKNATRLGVDLSRARAAFLSHGHYDHAGGFLSFLQVNREAKVYLRPAACEGHYAKGKGGETVDIGVPQALLGADPGRFVLVDSDVEVEPGVWLLSDGVEETEARAAQTGMLQRQADGSLAADCFHHEQSVVLEAGAGLVILNSCCHAGVVEIVKGVQRRFPQRPIVAVVGGFHLMGLGDDETLGVSREEVVDIGQSLFDLGVKKLITGHCTGKPALDILKQHFGDRVIHFSTGTQVEL
jgi:7,8-dihydropterin-6-yl-methyl-4-(beta-D-ribofuranosyl)aminobenzene 5'-phosphate synthase